MIDKLRLFPLLLLISIFLALPAESNAWETAGRVGFYPGLRYKDLLISNIVQSGFSRQVTGKLVNDNDWQVDVRGVLHFCTPLGETIARADITAVILPHGETGFIGVLEGNIEDAGTAKNIKWKPRTLFLAMSVTGKYIRAVVKDIVNGRTLLLDDGRRVKLIGLETPEILYNTEFMEQAVSWGMSHGSLRELGLSARDHLAWLCPPNTPVIIETDIIETDDIGDIFGYLWIDEYMVNIVMLEQGFARLSMTPPIQKYSSELMKAQEKAKKYRLGLWSDGMR